MHEKTHFLFDVDSTVIRHESLQDMVRESILENPDPVVRAKKLEELTVITNAGMNGEIDLQESIQKRLDLSTVRRWHMERVIEKMKENITEGMEQFMLDLHARGSTVWLLTAGLREMILPVGIKLRLPQSHILSNVGMWDGDRLIGFAPSPLLTNSGKAAVIAQLKKGGVIEGKTIMIGDGMNDLHTFLLGVADDFFGFGAHVVRPNVREKSPHYFMSVRDMRSFLRM